MVETNSSGWEGAALGDMITVQSGTNQAMICLNMNMAKHCKADL